MRRTVITQDTQMRRGASGARRRCVNLGMGRGRYQDSPTAVPRSALVPDWTAKPHADDSYSIAPTYEGSMLRTSRVCEGGGLGCAGRRCQRRRARGGRGDRSAPRRPWACGKPRQDEQEGDAQGDDADDRDERMGVPVPAVEEGDPEVAQGERDDGAGVACHAPTIDARRRSVHSPRVPGSLRDRGGEASRLSSATPCPAPADGRYGVVLRKLS